MRARNDHIVVQEFVAHLASVTCLGWVAEAGAGPKVPVTPSVDPRLIHLLYTHFPSPEMYRLTFL